jgi:ubiquinone/menaquinone biosynthesis C-methylase UbiE
MTHTSRAIRIHLDRPHPDHIAEDDYLRSSEDERASAELYRSLLYVGKAQYLLTFDDLVRRYDLDFEGTVLELGGGYGWLSSYLKKLHPGLRVVFSDVSREAVEKSHQYEAFFGVELDEKWVTAAEDTPFDDGTFDRVTFFASFHHAQDPRRALRECYRVLRPGGKLYLLYEPSAPGYLRPLYDRYVHRDEVPEKYYSVRQYRRMFVEAGFEMRRHNYTGFLHRRSPRAALYYAFLSALPGFLVNALPCSQVIVGRKPG